MAHWPKASEAMNAPLPTLPQPNSGEELRQMPERFFCAGCGEEISGEFCDDDGWALCRACDREQQAESAADRRGDR